METSARKVRVLCFGDSNTWGYSPFDQSRFPETVRWTGRLQHLLGSGYQVIEEGLNGRTTIFDYQNRPGKNGLEYLRPCLDSHFPIDVVILNLGTNDTKVEFGQTAEGIAAGLEQLVEAIFGKGLERPSPQVKLILVAPALVDEKSIGDFADLVGSETKTRQFPALYKSIAQRYGAVFVDLSNQVLPSTADGCHLEPAAHAKIAQLFYEQIVKS